MNVQMNRAFFQCYILRTTEINGHFDSGISQAITVTHSYKVYAYLFKTTPKLKMPRNMQRFLVTALNSIHLHFTSARSKGVWSLYLYLTLRTSKLTYLFRKEGWENKQEGMDKGFFISMAEKKSNEI